MASQDAAADIRRTLEGLKEVVNSGSLANVSEADTRAHFIDPLIYSLGFSSFSDVQREVYTTAKDFLDYVLLVNGDRRIAVEAKRLSHKLTEQDAAQVVQYCSVLGIEWAVLTNARELRLYHQYAHGPVDDKLLFRLDLVGWSSDADYAALFDQLWLLSKEAFTGQDGPMAWLRAQRIDAMLRDALTNPESVEVKYLRKRLLDQKIQAATAEVAGWFKARLMEPAPIPSPGPEPKPKPVPAPIHPTKAGQPIVTQVSEPAFWLAPAARRGEHTGEESARSWLGQGMWGMWASTPSRKALRPGDWLALNAVGTGVLGYGRITGTADVLLPDHELPEPQDKPTYKVPLTDIRWVEPPLVIDSQLRASLDAFKGRDPDMIGWGWLVQTTRRVSEADFKRLTRQSR